MIWKKLLYLLGWACVAFVPLTYAYFNRSYTPVQPIQIIVPYAAGGPADIIGRRVQEVLEKSGIESVVVNHAGASGNIGFARFMECQRRCLLIATDTISTNRITTTTYPTGILQYVQPVVNLGEVPLVVVFRPGFSFSDLISSTEVRIGHSGPGSKAYQGFQFLCGRVVPATTPCIGPEYRSSAQAISDLKAGRIDAYVVQGNGARVFSDEGVSLSGQTYDVYPGIDASYGKAGSSWWAVFSNKFDSIEVKRALTSIDWRQYGLINSRRLEDILNELRAENPHYEGLPSSLSHRRNSVRYE